MALLFEVVSKLAAREGVDPTELRPPLHEAVDVDALESLIEDTETRGGDPCRRVEFAYEDYVVAVEGDGTVDVRESGPRADRTEIGSASPSVDLPAESDARGHAIEEITDVVPTREGPFAEQLDGLLEALREVIGTESAALSYVNGDSYVFEHVVGGGGAGAGDVVSLGETACQRVVGTRRPLVLGDVEATAPGLADAGLGVAAYLGAPVTVDGEVYGTVCFYDRDAREEGFAEQDVAFAELLSEWVGSELEQRKRGRARHAARTDRPYTAN